MATTREFRSAESVVDEQDVRRVRANRSAVLSPGPTSRWKRSG